MKLTRHHQEVRVYDKHVPGKTMKLECFYVASSLSTSTGSEKNLKTPMQT